MLRHLLIVATCLAVCRSAIADDPVITNYPPQTISELSEAEITGNQVLDLPQDENKLYLTLYGNPNDEHYRELKSWFATNPGLVAIRRQTHYSAIDTTSKLFKERYADEVREIFCIRFVTPGGVELLRIDGKRIPMSERSLNNGIRTELIKRLFGRPEPKPEPKTPQEKLKQAINDKIDNDVNLPPVAKSLFLGLIQKLMWGLVVGAVVAGVVVAVVTTIREARPPGPRNPE